MISPEQMYATADDSRDSFAGDGPEEAQGNEGDDGGAEETWRRLWTEPQDAGMPGNWRTQPEKDACENKDRNATDD
jgi:hypothetical protein